MAVFNIYLSISKLKFENEVVSLKKRKKILQDAKIQYKFY